MLGPDGFPRLRAALEASDYARPLDLIAFDYYDPTLANQLRLASGHYDPWEWEAIPEGLEILARANATDGLPVFVAENGMATRRPVDGPPEPHADGLRRDDFLRAHLFHLLKAMKGGTPVAGYLHWSLADNYEWGRFSPRFGLHAVDYTDPERRRLPVDAAGVDAAGVFAAIARALVSRDVGALERALIGERVEDVVGMRVSQ
jgi:beta-glucosidase/6-phospho-beta-glucosidase/beta-galactosidase